MKAFHNKKSVKTHYLNRVKAHAAADEIVKGLYWEGGKGCAVGCTVHSSSHNAYETELGIPEWLAQVEDTIFENLPNKRAITWPEEFLSSIKVGADLEKVKGPFLVYLLQQSLKSMEKVEFDHKAFLYVEKAQEQVRVAVKEMIRLHKKGSKDPGAIESAERSAASAGSVARSAARSVEWSAERSAASAANAARSAESAANAAWGAARSAANAANAARSAARSAESAANAANAAWSSARSVEWSAEASVATKNATYIKFADKLLELLKSCK